MPQTELGRLGGKTTSINYLAWEKLPDLRPASYPGVQTSRDGALVGTDRAALEACIKFVSVKGGEASAFRDGPSRTFKQPQVSNMSYTVMRRRIFDICSWLFARARASLS
jgi:hypothetical protein